ncbi:MAG: hypothetical protein L6428_10505 [Candidatus Aminicenantes bacterium]|nr:hypothetical protein [Candidatus Aminicenantes bacterium]
MRLFIKIKSYLYKLYLIQEGFLQITPRGRLATEKAFRYFKKKIATPAQTIVLNT